MALVREISFFNSFLLKQLNQVVGTTPSTYTPVSPGGFPYNGTSGSFNQQKIGVNTISAAGSVFQIRKERQCVRTELSLFFARFQIAGDFRFSCLPCCEQKVTLPSEMSP